MERHSQLSIRLKEANQFTYGGKNFLSTELEANFSGGPNIRDNAQHKGYSFKGSFTQSAKWSLTAISFSNPQ